MPKLSKTTFNRTKLVKRQARRVKRHVCIACGGTGISSSGKPCVPCERRKYYRNQ